MGWRIWYICLCCMHSILSRSISTSKHSRQDGGDNNQPGGVYSLPIEIPAYITPLELLCL
jgi:hypothetical protein